MKRIRFQAIKETSLFCVISLFSGLTLASVCLEKPGLEGVIKIYGSGLQARAKWLDEIGSCVALTPNLASYFDNIANLGLLSADIGNWSSDDASRASYIRFNADLLLVLAKNGYANSQHNIAALHNARPGSAAAKAIKQDQEIFIYWTRKAAAQGEPRAIFNLGARIARGVPSLGIAQDNDLAFKLLAHLTKMNVDTKGALEELMPAVQQETKKVSESFDATRMSLLEKQAANLPALAPIGPPPGSTWDRASNVRKSIVLAYTTRKDSGNDAAWRTLQQCYADALLIRSYAREHEGCVAFDIATTQLTVALHGRQPGQASLPPQYEKNAFTNRLGSGLLSAGLPMKTVITEIDEIGKLVDVESQVAAESVFQGKKVP
jgi:hypothetical protein